MKHAIRFNEDFGVFREGDVEDEYTETLDDVGALLAAGIATRIKVPKTKARASTASKRRKRKPEPTVETSEGSVSDESTG